MCALNLLSYQLTIIYQIANKVRKKRGKDKNTQVEIKRVKKSE